MAEGGHPHINYHHIAPSGIFCPIDEAAFRILTSSDTSTTIPRNCPERIDGSGRNTKNYAFEVLLLKLFTSLLEQDS